MAKKVAPATVQVNLDSKVKRVLQRSPQFGSFYSNETAVQTGPWDVRLVFGLIEIADGDDGRTATTTQVAEVRMSPQHAANIVELIGAQLKGYEQKFGKIPAPHKVLSD